MLEDLAGPNQNIHFLIPSSDNSLESSTAVRKGYRRGYSEFGKGKKLYPERYRNGPVIALSREEIESFYPSFKSE